MQIDKDNDSLLTFDSLIVKVYSKDSSFSQVVFHGVLRDPKQVSSMPLDPRVGKEYTVSIVGYKGGKVGVNKAVTILGPNNFQSKDLPVQKEKPQDTIIVIEPLIPEILAPSDTSVAEGDSLRFRVSIRNPLSGATALTLKDTLPGAALDTAGRDPGDGYFTWRPNYSQGRSEPYAVTFVYASAARRVEKTARVKVFNVNRPPKIAAILDQKVKENETLTFKVEAADLDHDSITLTSSALPEGATFSTGSFSWKPTVGQAGNYSAKFKASDGKDSDLVAVLITVGNVDVPPPLDVKITSPANDTTINFTPITILYSVNGTLLEKKLPLKDGKNRIFIDTTVAGRTAFDTVTITLDQVAPGMPIVKGVSLTSIRTPTWTWITGGGGNGTYRYRLDLEDMTLATVLIDTVYTPSKGLEAGSHTLYVQERDAAGNWSASGHFTVRIDTIPPSPPTVSTPVALTNNTLPTWTWSGSGSDVTGLFRYKLDNADLRTGAVETKGTSYTPKTGEELKEGSHTLYVQQQDSVGNWSASGSAVIRVDLTPPASPQTKTTPTSPTNIIKPIWSWTSGGNGGAGTYRMKLDDSVLTSGAITGSALSFTPDTNLKEGSHTLYVQERDTAGNWSKNAAQPIRIDLTPPSAPVFSTLPLSPLNSLQPVWTWVSGGGGGSGSYRCKVDTANLEIGAAQVSVSQYSPLANLSQGPHTLYVQERDSAGNWSPATARPLLISLREVVGTPGFSGKSIDRISLVFSNAGVAFVAFRDGNNGDKATVMRWSGTAWVNVGNQGFSAGWAASLSLAISSSGVPYVAFADGANDNRTTVMRFDGIIWETVGTAGFSVGNADSPSLALSSTGVPYVLFTETTLDYKAKVMRWSGTAWENVGIAGFSAGSADYHCLAIGSTGVPYVSFQDGANGNKTTVMRWNGIAWENVGNAGMSVGTADGASLAINGSGVPYVAYRDYANGYKATVMRWSGTTWENVGNAGFSAGSADAPSLTIDGTGTPYLAYRDGANSNKATVVRWSGTAWESVGLAGFTVGKASSPSLAISSTGVPYVAFIDGANGDKATVMKTSYDP